MGMDILESEFTYMMDVSMLLCRLSFSETLSLDFQDYGPLIDPSIEQELQGT